MNVQQNVKNAKKFTSEVLKFVKQGDTSKPMTRKIEHLLEKVARQSVHEETAVVKTAVQLTEQEKNQIAQILSQHFDKTITVQNEVQEQIIAGIIIQIGDLVIDTSFDSQITNLMNTIKS